MSQRSDIKVGSKIVVRQVRSAIGREPSVRASLQSLGLGRIGKESSFTANPSLLGVITKLAHLVEVRSA